MVESPFETESFRLLSEFRFQIRHFLQFSQSAARKTGLEPQQHQLLLAIKGLPAGTRPTVRALANKLCLRHNSTVELLNRLAARGYVVRKPGEADRREVLIELTPEGQQLLERLAIMHLQELRTAGPALLKALQDILQQCEQLERTEAPQEATV